jgi:AcrR family transcriptional regulator
MKRNFPFINKGMKKKTRSDERRFSAEKADKPAPPRTKAHRGKAAGRPYHHGALRQALLQAAEDILAEEGIGGLTLRAAARKAGASHAAPKNHFDDLTGLLSELAAVGFRRFSADLRAAAEKEPDPERRSAARGRAYVHFAERHPGLFQLMFRSERLDDERPALREAMDDATRALGEVVDEGQGHDPEMASRGRLARMVAAWSLVHGFSMLLLDGRIKGIMRHAPDDFGTEDLLADILGLKPEKRDLSTP